MVGNHRAAHQALGRVHRLDDDVHQLVRTFPELSTPLADLGLRAHEILENTLQLELTGHTDEGSHTNLATARADVDGTDLVLAALDPVLAAHAPDVLASARTSLERLQRALDATRRPDGSWTPVQSLSTADRERIDATMGQALEHLALVPDHLESEADRD